MDYFQLLDLKKEPFSNSPDPDFFYGSRQHLACLQKLELSIRLRRGLNVVVADVGVGKTTLCRQLIRRFVHDKDVQTHLLLDPACATPLEFLSIIAKLLGQTVYPGQDTEHQLKERIKDHLFARGVEQNKVTVLIIDEGQKLPVYCVEVLREFLNYETNAVKLLQIVIFAQTEFDEVLAGHKNFADRVSCYQTLKPFSYAETKAMVRFRLREAAEGVVPALFTSGGLWAIFLATGGYPRKIVELGYRVLLALIVQNRKKAGWRLVRSCARRGVPVAQPFPMVRQAVFGLLLLCSVGALALSAQNNMEWAGRLLARDSITLAAAAPGPVPAPVQPAPVAVQPSAAPLAETVAAPPPAEEAQAESLPGPGGAIPESGEIVAAPPVPAVEPAALASAPVPAQEHEAKKPVSPFNPAAMGSLTNMWGGRFLGYSQIIFWFDRDVAFQGPEVGAREAGFRFSHAQSTVAPFRQYTSFPGWVALKGDGPDLLARIGLPSNLEGMEHFILRDPFRVVVNLYHDQPPPSKDNT